ncbi:putative pentatricopeptide repeat-containing protein At5g09950 [Solanum dulcamara]|uniref:putative pentatricopeptide repeat-containing protein At5g09950 n=1 Tax=Solanum dulcamara TaxID=45834 RepID=UPI0024850243|nr:putative pentatricopeptide repeat-containing protein At5g09950 [Solanum dulcamara]XP_055824202.1 putative pentatricopeptide repeat-containing protein At5g09950 [Solanum dulcamara]XP_055824203.1 putative pentatricopeptide repeat-containing protein At5g09950 [Solanum dulcamara]XP_055824204.1 putative pentatricopeptide repeat-containing protein At5g09950 [Solanum dulcamara]XP_055824205.1 putative pentatricopeptide repeat-containing protein At5g09950 [Solanum dulcamara]
MFMTAMIQTRNKLLHHNPNPTFGFTTFAASIFQSFSNHSAYRTKDISFPPTQEPVFQFKDSTNLLNNNTNPIFPSTHLGAAVLPEKPAYSVPTVSDKCEYLVQKYLLSFSEHDAHRLHLDIIKYGAVKDLYLCNTLINLYVKNADLISAHDVFDEMPNRNLVTWACLITGYSQNGMPDEACRVFQEMVSSRFIPNHYACGSALRSCQGLGACGLRLGMQIHGLLLKTGHASNEVVSNVLISMYGSCAGNGDYAWRVFEEIENKNSVSCNSIISVYSQRGAISAFELFSYMQKEDLGFTFKPTEFTFGSLITTAANHVNCGLLLLEQLLANIEKSGLLEDLYVGSALLSGFGRFGSLDTAMKVFKRMGARNAVSLNGLMVGLVRLGQGEDAAKVFMEMRDLVKINSDSFVVLFSAFPEFSSFEEGKIRGRELHAYVIRTGLCNSKAAIGNALINMYSKFGEIQIAHSVFQIMVNKDSVSWNSMISALDQNDCFEDAMSTFQSMRRTGLIASNYSLISTLSSCGSLNWIRLGEQLHSEGIKLGLDFDVSVSNTLLALYADTGRVAECKKLFALMLEHDQVSWNTIIGALGDSETSISEAIEYFIQMMCAGWSPNNVTFINVLSAISSLSLLGLVRQIHALVLKYSAMDANSIENTFLACYGKCGEMDYCENIFCGMSNRKDDVSWNLMISGYLHNEILPKAMDLVWLMLHKGQKLDGFTFASVLSACASIATLEHGMEVHACAIRACLESDIVVGSALVDMYAKCGRIDYASRFFDLMPVRNIYSWNSMISGYARHGHGHKALDLFTKMKLDGQTPDHVTFVGVLSACSHVGFVEQGMDYFDSMSKQYGLTPRIEHFSCMVDILGRAGQMNKLEDFINKMPLKPNALIWRTVLGACGRASTRKTDLGRKAAHMLLELEPHNAVNYVLLANMYASGGKWEDVAEARRAMREATVRKEAGCSWVSMRDGVHVFVAGDQSHPDKHAIYEKLKELHKRIRDAGYVPQIKYALYDLELENKEELLSYHSERLAVAFVLTRTSDMPIRIMKNLRVCGDCHSAFRYISQVVGRQIVLRDSNRFHHFADGKCSCNDYW